MNHRNAWAGPLGLALIGAAAAVGLATVLLVSPPALAQTTPPKPAAKPATKPAPKPPAAAQPAPQQQQQAQPPQQQAAPAPQLMYSPWVKFCGKNQETGNKEVCVVTKDGKLENGMPVAIVQLFEPEGQPKILRITVPLGMQLSHGTRIILDQAQPMQQPYKICFPVGCMSDYPVTDEMLGQMKKGKTITIQAINMQGTPISLPMPLNDFGKALDGPPTDPKVFEEQQKKLQEELQKKAEEARKKLESQPPAAEKK